MGHQMTVNVTDASSKTLGYLTLPFSDPGNASKFSSIHSNPPGVDTDSPAIVVTPVGEGLSIYIAATVDLNYYGALLDGILREHTGIRWSCDSTAPECVEITVFDDHENDRILLHLVNYQSQVPPIPVCDFAVNVSHRLPGDVEVKSLFGKSLKDAVLRDGTAEIHFDRLDMYSIVEIRARIK
ncbi:MAG: hypothetical protein EA383_10600 [Spirochaetaceae bacterium]|nr:MAG: hypothetical protein EA383_10600 [Spirochaetaceae bacterium]